VELGLLEQRHKAGLEVLNGVSVTDVARPSVRGGLPDPARLAAALREARDRRARRPQLQAR